MSDCFTVSALVADEKHRSHRSPQRELFHYWLNITPTSALPLASKWSVEVQLSAI